MHSFLTTFIKISKMKKKNLLLYGTAVFLIVTGFGVWYYLTVTSFKEKKVTIENCISDISLHKKSFLEEKTVNLR
jgi:hypothetical protein